MLQLVHTSPVPAPPVKSVHELPPLILHPISQSPDAYAPRSADDGENARDAARRLELRMLCCLGKDLTRWLEQCLEVAAADPELAALSAGQFLDLLVDNPPENITRKMQAWGVPEFRSIFARALGLATVFPHPPAADQVSDIFVRDFSRYATVLYRARRAALPASPAGSPALRFEVYASGEYAQLLEQSWGL